MSQEALGERIGLGQVRISEIEGGHGATAPLVTWVRIGAATPSHRLPDDLRERLVDLATTTYAGANRAHLAELLAEREDLVVPARTLRRILDEAGLAAVRTRRPTRQRSRRERMPRAGLLVQTDGSRHDWLEGRGPGRPRNLRLRCVPAPQPVAQATN